MKEKVTIKRQWYDTILSLPISEQNEASRQLLAYLFDSSAITIKELDDAVRSKKRVTPFRKIFNPPTEYDVVKFFTDNGYRDEVASKAYKYYATADWHDSRGNPVKNWKQKMVSVWFTDSNKKHTPNTYSSSLTDRDRQY